MSNMTQNMFLPLATIEAARPVFMIVMGVFLLIFTWRMSKEEKGWSAWLMMGGAILLAFGYAILLPLYEAGKIERYYPGKHVHDSSAIGWHATKLLAMNAGWFVFATGLGIHSGFLKMPAFLKATKPQPAANYESIA